MRKLSFISLLSFLFLLIESCNKDSEVNAPMSLSIDQYKSGIRENAQLFGEALRTVMLSNDFPFGGNVLYESLTENLLTRNSGMEQSFFTFEKEYFIRNGDIENSLMFGRHRSLPDLPERVKTYRQKIDDVMVRQAEFISKIDDIEIDAVLLQSYENDTAMALLKTFELNVLQGLLNVEKDIEIDADLSLEEKIDLVTGTSIAMEAIPILLNEFLEIYEKDLATARQQGFWRKVGNVLKKVVNGVATVVGSIINEVLTVLPAFAAGFIANPVAGIFFLALGAVAGFVNGITSVITGGQNGAPYVCLLCVNTVGDPCYVVGCQL